MLCGRRCLPQAWPVADSRLPPEAAWWGVCALLGLLTWGLWGQPSTQWDWQPDRFPQEWWRLWTAAGVHFSAQHGLLNLGGLLLLAWLGWQAEAGGPQAKAWSVAWPLTHLGLLVRPDLAHYGGLSGVLHAGLAVLAASLLCQTSPRHRWLGGALALGLVLKLLSEQPWGPAVQAHPSLDIGIAPMGHVCGVLGGIIGALLFVRRPAA